MVFFLRPWPNSTYCQTLAKLPSLTVIELERIVFAKRLKAHAFSFLFPFQRLVASPGQLMKGGHFPRVFVNNQRLFPKTGLGPNLQL